MTLPDRTTEDGRVRRTKDMTPGRERTAGYNTVVCPSQSPGYHSTAAFLPDPLADHSTLPVFGFMPYLLPENPKRKRRPPFDLIHSAPPVVHAPSHVTENRDDAHWQSPSDFVTHTVIPTGRRIWTERLGSPDSAQMAHKTGFQQSSKRIRNPLETGDKVHRFHPVYSSYQRGDHPSENQRPSMKIKPYGKPSLVSDSQVRSVDHREGCEAAQRTCPPNNVHQLTRLPDTVSNTVASMHHMSFIQTQRDEESRSLIPEEKQKQYGGVYSSRYFISARDRNNDSMQYFISKHPQSAFWEAENIIHLEPQGIPREVICNTANNPHEILEEVLCATGSKPHDIPDENQCSIANESLGTPGKVLSATAYKLQDNPREVLCTTGNRTQGIPRGVQCSTAYKPQDTPREVQSTTVSTPPLCSTVNELQDTSEKVMCTTVCEPQDISRDSLCTTNNRPPHTPGEIMCTLANKPPGIPEGIICTSAIESSGTPEEIIYISANKLPGTLGEAMCNSTSKYPRHSRNERYLCLFEDKLQGTPGEDQCNIANESVCIPREAVCTMANSPQGTSGGIQRIVGSKPQGSPKEGYCTFTYKLPSTSGERQYTMINEAPCVPGERLCTIAKKPLSTNVQAFPLNTTCGNQQTQLVSSIPAVQSDRNKSSDQIHPHQTQPLSGCGRQPDGKPVFKEEGNFVSLGADCMSRFQTEKNINAANSTDFKGCLQPPSHSGQKPAMNSVNLNGWKKSMTVTDQVSNTVSISLSCSLSMAEEDTDTRYVRLNGGPNALYEHDSRFNCVWPKKSRPSLSESGLQTSKAVRHESTLELPQKLQCAIETEPVSLDKDSEIRTEMDCSCSGKDPHKTDRDPEKIHSIDIRPRRQYTDSVKYNLFNQSGLGNICKPQNMDCIKVKPERNRLSSEKFGLGSTLVPSQTGKNGDHVTQSNPLLDVCVSDKTNGFNILKSLISSNTESSCCIMETKKPKEEIVCTYEKEQVPSQYSKSHGSIEDTLEPVICAYDNPSSCPKIVETVSLAELTHSKRNSCLHRRSREGFYRCGCQAGTCFFSTQLPVDFVFHLQDAHKTEKLYPCIHCGGQESSPKLLRCHVDQHLVYQGFNLYCTQPDCDFHSFHPDRVIQHMAISHPFLTARVCWCCGQWLATLQQFKHHIKENLLHVTLCPHCDAKDTDYQRMLIHVTSVHPDSPCMIVFHKLLMCGERKRSGWKLYETALNHAATAAQGNAGSGKISGTVITTADHNNTECGNTTVAADVTTNHSNSDNHAEQASESATGNETERKVKLKPENGHQSHDQNIEDKDKRYQRLCHGISDNGSKVSKASVQGLDNQILEERVLSTHDVSLPDRDGQHVHRIHSSLFCTKIGEDFDCMNSKTQLIVCADRDELSMEPVDLEISVHDSFDENDHQYSHEGEPLATSHNVNTVPCSTDCFSSSHPQEQTKFYRCTVVAAGRSIKLFSSKSIAAQTATGHSCAEKSATKTRSVGGGSGPTFSDRRQAKIYSCRLCPFSSHFSRGIYEHMYTRHSHILHCPQCEEKCKTRSALHRHLRHQHPNEAKALFHNSKVTRWIRITRRDPREVTPKDGHMTSLNEQTYPVKNYFVFSGHGKEMGFHCVLCEYSFKKHHRSNANIYRSMYKHLFLQHLPHKFLCPTCHFTNAKEDKIRKHMKKKHGDSEQEPEILVLFQSSARHAQGIQHFLRIGSSGSAVRRSKRERKKKTEALMD